MGKHFDSYIKIMKQTSPEAVDSIIETTNKLVPEHIESFSHQEHIKGLLLGQVQSGKTGQMFGLIASAADVDEGFAVFILLTSDITALQQQTLKRALGVMDTFNVCDEHDEVRFMQNELRRPSLIVLKKNQSILKKWRNILLSSKFLNGRPIFVVDDEADAASLNTKVNSREQSTINRHLGEILDITTSSFYLQVTATPQSLLLQTEESGWKPSFVYYFPPGKKYLGGEFFYTKPKPFTNITTADDELDILLNTDEIAEGLKLATETYLLTAAHMTVNKESDVCNFLVHPSIRIYHHEQIKTKVVDYLEYLFNNLDKRPIISRFEHAWKNLQSSKPQILKLNELLKFLATKPAIKVITLNSGPEGDSRSSHETGLNIVIGGNSLGRGVTFNSLQTVYYCRNTRSPQADTFWQHCRMFGYDRDPALMRVFMPFALFNLFAEINASNEMLIHQLANNKFDALQIITNKKLRPTRRSVIDQERYEYIVGGVNYFPPLPQQDNASKLDGVLEIYDEKPMHDISIDDAIKIVSKLDSDPTINWSVKAFTNALEALKAHKGSPDLAKLLVRRGRKISAGTGTLLSPTDRKLGSDVDNLPVITMYRLVGDKESGWRGKAFWIPNIKMPNGKVFHRVD